MPLCDGVLVTITLKILLLGIDSVETTLAASVPTTVARAREQAAAPPTQAPTNETCTVDDAPPPLMECGVYMAPSTVGNHSNLGIYTGVPLQSGEVINYPEIAIPLLFRDFDQHPPNSLGDGTLWDRYIWGGHVADIDPIDDFSRQKGRSVFVPGVGCTVNSMLDLHNIRSTQGSTYDTARVKRHDPAAGSFSPYHGSRTVTTRKVSAGSELFANYGDGWIPNIPNVAVTFDRHLDNADRFLKHYQDWLSKIMEQFSDTDDLTPELLNQLWKMTKNMYPSRDFSVLPPEMDWHRILAKVRREKEHTTSGAKGTQEEASPTRDYWRAQSIRPIEWLQRYGKCQDHIRPGISTIPNAGWGAFASRHLPRGAIAGYAPLIHVGEAAEQLLQFTYPSTTIHRPNRHYTRPELVINYSFGHPNSTLILTPYGAGVNYINHASEGRTPNVRVRWPKEESVAHKPDWLHENVRYLRDTTGKIGLSFDYVTLRDIAEGEELFMDYGPDWEASWERHLATHVPPSDASTYVHSSEYPSRFLKTRRERDADPYPPNLHTLCRPWYARRSDGTYVFARALRPDDQYLACEVLERNLSDSGTDAHYTVRLILANQEPLLVQGVPRPEGIQLFDKVFSQDMHLPQAFRHPISIPDDIFPPSWKNRPPP